MRPRLVLVALLLAGMGFASTWRDRADGCAVVLPRGKVGVPAVHVDFNTETALIVWDASHRTQHFIRKASFHTAAEHFGFLVPTPSRPELAEAPDAVFTKLAQITTPPSPPVRAGSAVRPGAVAHTAAPTVTVLETKQVAGYDAAILEANDATALNDWLARHEYQSSPELVDWLQPYIDRSWIITAVKIAKSQPKAPGVGSNAVRMSFQTDQPFFPYREPAPHKPAAPTSAAGSKPDANPTADEKKNVDVKASGTTPVLVEGDVIARQTPEAQEIIRKLLARIAAQEQRIVQLQHHAPVFVAKPARSLKVYFLAEGQYQGTLGEAGQWPGRMIYSKPIADVDRTALVKLLGIEGFDPPQGWWLTEFLDGSVVRPGHEDVLFSVHEKKK